MKRIFLPFVELSRRKGLLSLEIKVEGFEMSKEDLVKKLVNLEVENHVLNIKFKALLNLLAHKQTLEYEGELLPYCETLLGEMNSSLLEHGIDPDIFQKVMRSKIGLD